MKTIQSVTLVLGLLLAVSLTSCQKEQAGVYHPKKKIQQLYASSKYSDKAPYQHWEWNGDLLSSITHYSEYNFKGDVWIENFTYDNNRLTRVDNYTNSEYITYEYDGDHLKSATVFYRNAIVCTWAVSYEGEHISKLAGTIYDSYKKDGLRLNPLTHLLPSNLCESVVKQEQKLTAQRHQNEMYTLVLLLTWTNNNISKLVFTGDGDYLDFELEYDDKICPLYGFMGNLEDYVANFDSGHTGFTKNNVTSMILSEDDYKDTLRFAYQYDIDNYPVLQTSYLTDDPDDKQVLYYEY